MTAILFWGFVLRVLQALMEASPTILFGLLTAGVLRRMLTATDVRRMFGSSGIGGLVRAWIYGMLLPVCSFGVLPVTRECRRAGVAAGCVLAFALAAPLLNPLSVLYGLTLSEPLVIFSFVNGSLLVSVIAGLVWARWFTQPTDTALPPPEPMPPYGLKRLAAIVVHAAREATGPVLLYLGVGLLGVGLLSVALPAGALQTTMRHRDPTSPLLMAAVALPAYDPPMKAMMQLGLMFDHGNSVGAAYVLLVLGAGANLGLLAWVWRNYDWRRTAAWFTLVVAVTLMLAWGMEYPLYFSVQELDHTHAFDDFCCPFQSGMAVDWTVVRNHLSQRLLPHELASLLGLAGLMVLGGVLRALDARGLAVEQLLLRPEPVVAKDLPFWNRPIPAPVLGGIALLGLLAFGVLGCYIYYPAPNEVFEEISGVRALALAGVNSGHKEEAIRGLERWDNLSRKLQVGDFLRTGRMDAAAQEVTEALRGHLEELRDALLADDLQTARRLVPSVEAAHKKCRQAYLVRN